ncbi:hypothetical protein LEMLEM_LOCUS3359 [Lemmus lemmus]
MGNVPSFLDSQEQMKVT